MATRDEILRELKLAPEWRLRGDATPGQDRPVEAASARGASPAGPSSRPIVAAEDPVARRERIAALDWDAFEADVAACTACGLCRSRNRAVPGVGDRRAEWLFVGEGPGAEEDAKGEPFVGQAGKLLDSMLAALGMRRDANVYIANVVKCRPPNNRTPEPAEAEACRPYLERQIALIRPKLIVALGKSAASLLLGTDATIASLRGRRHRYGETPLVVTYHPAYLLRNLPDKAKAWEDLVFARSMASSVASADPPVA
ncbi:MAG: uracil-DNA glycosylase [Burkholderiales bacterium]|jgi:DNA polymerase|nr:uracil-DNA glycosylase [Burkholderiales bacterium]